MARIDPNKLNLEERVVQINRVAKVVKVKNFYDLIVKKQAEQIVLKKA
jgi:hypothetical protein